MGPDSCMFLEPGRAGRRGCGGGGGLQNLCVGCAAFQKWQDHLEGESETKGSESCDKVRMSRSCLESPGVGERSFECCSFA